jgi:hypothetical protein
MPKKKGKKAKAAAVEEPEPEPQPEEPWICLECEQENEASDEACIACDEPRPAPPEAADERYVGYKVGALGASPLPPIPHLLATCRPPCT